MTADSVAADAVSALRKTLHENARLKAAFDRLVGEQTAPVAIVGAGCHFPGGVDGLADLWDLMAGERDAVGPVPPDRDWADDRVEGGFLADVGRFDAGFFGLSEGEALVMDPQQRWFLETCWEALEDARIVPSRLRGSEVGVFAGMMPQNYGLGLQTATGAAAAALEAYGATALEPSVLSARVSYLLGLTGPAVTVDTACSSGLVALHLACQSVRSGESSVALAGGVQVLTGPEYFTAFERLGGIARNGRCKSYADGADGTTWGEGVGVVVVERLADALRRGHRVRAVVRGSAVNQDGASNGLTAPNGPAQERVIRRALANARVEAGQIDAVEGHGTGTALGDPIELGALLAVYGPDRGGAPLWLGSVKSNIGHTGAVAGMAGLLKMVAALEHETLPASLWSARPTRAVDWSGGGVALLSRPRSWPRGARPRLAGVSSFGVSGTNAHVVVEEAPLVAAAALAPAGQSAAASGQPVGEMSVGAAAPAGAQGGLVGEGAVCAVVSGPGLTGLAGQARSLASWIAGSADDLADLGWSSAVTRELMADRALVVARDRAGLADGLARLGAGQSLAAAGADYRLVAGKAVGTPPRVVFVFPGQGAQWPGMGRGLWAASAVFREVVERCQPVVQELAGWSLTDVLVGSGDLGLDRVDVVQPALFAVMVGLAELWRSVGVVPDAVVGHSQGEIAAAVVAGALTVEEGCRVVVGRSRQLRPLAGQGAMASIDLPADQVEALLAQWPGEVGVAALNSPTTTLISGSPAAVEEVLAVCRSRDVRGAAINVDYASHGPQIDALRRPILEATGAVRGRPSAIPFWSTVTGGQFDTTGLDGEYWFSNLRRPVRLAPVVAGLAAAKPTLFVEVSPHPVVLPSLEQCLDRVGTPGAALPTLRRDEDERRSFLAAVGGVVAHGRTVDWAGVFGAGRAAVDLPRRAFSHQSYWLPRPRLDDGPGAARLGLAETGHPLLAGRLSLADGHGVVLTGRLSLAEQPWLADHAVAGALVVPAAVFLDMVWETAGVAGANRIDELVLSLPLILDPDRATVLQVTADADGAFELFSRPDGDEAAAEWTSHASGRWATGFARPPATGQAAWPRGTTGEAAGSPAGSPATGEAAWPPAGSQAVDLTDFYGRLAEHEFVYGESFQGLRRAWTLGQEVFAELAVPVGGPGFRFLPALLDSGLQSALLLAASAVPAGGATANGAAADEASTDRPPTAAATADTADGAPTDGAAMPFAFNGATVWGSPVDGRARVHGRRGPNGTMKFALADASGRPLATIESMLARPVDVAALRRLAADDLYHVEWVPAGDRLPAPPAGPAALPSGPASVPGSPASVGPGPTALGPGPGELPGGPALPADPPADAASPRQIDIAGKQVGANAPADATGPAGPAPVDAAAGAPLVIVGPEPAALVGAADRPPVYPDRAAFLAALEQGAAPRRVVVVVEGVGPTPPERAKAAARDALAWLHLALDHPGLADADIVFATGGAVAALPGDPVDRPDAAAVWGLVRSAQLEHPGRFALVDVDADGWARLPGWLAGPTENQAALRGDRVLVPRLAKAAAGPPLPGLDPDGTVVVTGGIGALGSLLARHLATAHGVRRLVLISRRGPAAPGADELAADLAAAGSEVVIESCDVTDRDQLAAVFDRLPDDRPLTGVVHVAGLTDDALIADLGDDQVDVVIDAKVAPAWHVDELLAARPGGDQVVTVYYSSSAALLGAPGVGNYAAANAVLEAWAARGHARGRASHALSWGLWGQAEGGFTAVRDAADPTRAAFRRSGLKPLSNAQGLALFDRALGLAVPTLLATPLDLALIGRSGLAEFMPLWSALAPAAGPLPQASLKEELRALAPERRRDHVVGVVLEQVAAVIPGATPTADETFKDLGLQSLGAVELRNRLAFVSGLKLPATVGFDYPTPARVADYLLAELVGDLEPGDEAAPGAAASPAPRPSEVAAPIAIIGAAGRFPTRADDLDAFWRELSGGVDAVAQAPAYRGWSQDSPYQAGFLEGAGDFDAAFFNVSDGEALLMDPQQRLFLETCWQALEDARLKPSALLGSPVGVFAGVQSAGYGLGADVADLGPELTAYGATGADTSAVAGRVSYSLGLTGPALSINTACSSSLVALHVACQSLRTGESSLALAGGVSILTGPEMFEAFTELGNVAADGRCKAYADGADGTAWGEGVGVVVVELLSEALRLGHRVRAVVRGSAVNQDGASNGLAAPNGPAQQRVIRGALANAGVAPDEVDLVEGHGTGTALGDPIEAQALLAVYGQHRPAGRPLWLGSVKSNIGHTMTAAGVASLLKVVLALEHEAMPPTLWAERPSGQVDWGAGAVELLTTGRPWPRGDRPRRAGVSSFGLSGTNAHVIVEEAPARAAAPAPSTSESGPAPISGPGSGDLAASLDPGLAAGEPAASPDPAPAAGGPVVEPTEAVPRPGLVGGDGPWLWPVSARGEAGLARQAGRLADWARTRLDDPADLGWSLVTVREAMPDRAAIIAHDRAGAIAGLEAMARGIRLAPAGSDYALTVNRAGPAPKTAFVFPGHGAQLAGMGQGLLRASEVFRSVVDRCDHVLARLTGWSLADVLARGHLDSLDVLQPALFAVMVGLAEVWRSCGVVPAAVVGHSQGEVAAAVVAGALPLEEGLRLVVARGQVVARAVGQVPGIAGAAGQATGAEPDGVASAMASVNRRVDEVRELLAGFGERLSVAAVNSPANTTVSGEPAAVAELVALGESRGLRVRPIPVGFAGHSAQVDPLRPELLRAVGEMSGRPSAVPFYSTVTAGLFDTTGLDAEYWFANLRQTVLFAPVVRQLAEAGVSLFLDLGPWPALLLPMEETLRAAGAKGRVVASLGRDVGRRTAEPEAFLKAVAQVHCLGLPVDWRGVFGDDRHEVDLPGYAFARRRFWLGRAFAGSASARAHSAAAGAGLGQSGGPVGVSGSGGSVGGHGSGGPVGGHGSGGPVGGHGFEGQVGVYGSGGQVGAPDVGALYRVSWLPADTLATAPMALPPIDRWAVIGAPEPALLAALPDGTRRYDRWESFAADLATLGAAPLRAVVCLPADGAEVPDRAMALARGVLAVLKDCVGQPRWMASELVVVTEGAVATGPDDAVPHPEQAALWGLVRSARNEFPGNFTLVDTDAASLADVPRLLAEPHEDTWALRRGRALVARLTAVEAETPAWPEPDVAGTGPAPDPVAQIDPAGTVVITGGTGTLSGLLAQHVVRTRGVKRLLLLSRRGPLAPGADDLRDRLAALGAEVAIEACDVADRDQLAGALGRIPADRPLTGVIHAAAILAGYPIPELTDEQVDAVMRVKVATAWHLHELTAGNRRVVTVYYSSLSGTIGAPSQSNYAAANAFLDALAAHRAHRGYPTHSIDWGYWADISELSMGMDPVQLARIGVRPITAEEGHELFDAAVARPEPALLATPVNLGYLESVRQGLPPFWHVLMSPVGPVDRTRQRRLAAELALLAPEQRRDHVVKVLLGHLRAVVPNADPQPDTLFKDLGVQSLAAIELRNRLMVDTGLDLSVTLALDSPTPLAAADYVVAQFEATEVAATGQALADAAATGALFRDFPTLSPDADTAVYIFPHLGATSAYYHPLAQRLAPFYDCRIFHDPAAAEPGSPQAATLAELADQLADAVRADGRGRVILFGHSLGSTIAFEVARRLPRTRLLVVSAGVAPGTAPDGAADALDRTIARLVDGLTAEAVPGADARAFLRRKAAADVALISSYRPVLGARVDVPVLSLIATDDTIVPRALSDGWASLTTAAFRQVEFPGDHFFLDAQWSAIGKLVIAADVDGLG